MSLSESALEVAFNLRQFTGSDKCGVGPDANQLISLLEDINSSVLRNALEELHRAGWINLETGLASNSKNISKELRDVVGVSVREPLQVYFDDLESSNK